MEWLIQTSWMIVLPIFVAGFIFHKLGRQSITMGFWLLALIIGFASISEVPSKIATLNKYPDDQSLVWAEISLIFFTGIVAFLVARFFLSGTRFILFFSPKERAASKTTGT